MIYAGKIVQYLTVTAHSKTRNRLSKLYMPKEDRNK